jgi:hypothetical protein
MSTFSLKVYCEFDRYYSVIIEDDGRVAYAYMYWGEDIVGDVWLYNQAETPTQANWDEIPSLNPAEYVNNNASISPITNDNEVRCEWTESPDGIIEIEILIRGQFIAGIAAGSKPGWSALVVKDGPLALVY